MNTIVIDVTPPGGSTEDITDLVLFDKTNFTSQVNGAPGDCLVRVKDTGHTESYKTGSVVRLTIDGTLRWAGPVMKATRTWPFYVEPTTNPQTAPRYIELAGMDYNLLFQKRILRYLSTPASPVFKLYAPGSYDDDILNDVLTNFTEILGEGFTKSISRVGIAIYDIGGITVGGRRSTGGIVWNAGDRLGDAFASVARATSGIYYITPDKVITYCDVDSPTSSYKLTDIPAGGSDIGYAALKLTESGDALVNDALVWGAALGASHMVFERVQDATSIALHGQWQAGNFSQGLYKATSATFVATTMVDGTPSSKRGAKDDKRSFEVKTPGARFNLGEKVECVSAVWGFDMVLPVRKITYTFPTPHDVFQSMVLSYEVDQPFDVYESLFPSFRIPGISIPPIAIIGGGPVLSPPAACTLSSIDTFLDRVTTNTLGTASDGLHIWTTDVWTVVGTYGVSFSGVHSGGFVQANSGSPATLIAHTSHVSGEPWAIAPDLSFQVTFSFTGVLGGAFFIEFIGSNMDMSFEAGGPVFLGNGTIGVDDSQNNWFDSFDYPFILNTEYVMEGYVKNTIGSGCRVYKVGDTPPPWVFPSAGSGVGGPTAEFAYDDGSVAGIDSSVNLTVRLDAVPSPSVYYWHDFSAGNCIIGTSSGGGVPLTGNVTETALDSGNHQLFSVSRSYAPGSTVITIDGLYRHDYTESDPVLGTITFNNSFTPPVPVIVVDYLAQFSP